MIPGSSEDKAREDFAAYVRSTVSEPAPAAPDSPSPGLPSLGLFENLFDFRIALAGLGLLFMVFAWSSHMDAARYRAIFEQHRYSMGTSTEYRWRYDGRDNNMYAPDRHLSFFDRERLRHEGLHVTYDDYATHRLLKSVKMASGILFLLGLIIAVRSGWKRFQDGGDEDFGNHIGESTPPAALPRNTTARPTFGRRAG